MNPQLSPMQQALQKQQMVTQPQPDASQVQPPQDPNQMGQPDPNQQPGIIDALNQQNQQGQQSIDARMQQKQSDQQAAMSKAMGMLSSKAGASTSAVGKMASVGQSIATPAYAGYCLRYADDKLGTTNRQPTAIADYQANAQKGNIVQSDKNIPKNAKVYWNADSTNGDMGHVGISNGDGTFTSATDSGIKTYSLSDWQKYSGQQYIGYAPTAKK